MTHRHYWLVSAPDGRPVLPARCRDCPATRTFAAAEPPGGTEMLRAPVDYSQVRAKREAQRQQWSGYAEEVTR